MVKEGTYPPPPENISKKPGFLASCHTYATECFTHKLYWYFFISTACTYMCWLTGTFTLARNRDSLGLTLEQIGYIAVCHSLVSFSLQYPAGWVADRWHPLAVYYWSHIIYIGGNLAQCLLIFYNFGPQGNFYFLLVVMLIFQPFFAIANASEMPTAMRLLPRDRFGQFASASAVVRAFTMIFGSTAAAFFIQSLEGRYGENRYVFVPVWIVIFQILAVIFLALLWKQWKLHGGYENYVAPIYTPPAKKTSGVEVATEQENSR